MFVRTRCQSGPLFVYVFFAWLCSAHRSQIATDIHLTKIKCILNWWRSNAKWRMNEKGIGKIATGMDENLNFRKLKIFDCRIEIDCSADAGAKPTVQRVHPAISAGHTTNLNLFAFAVFSWRFHCGRLAALNFLNRTILPIRVYGCRRAMNNVHRAHTHTFTHPQCGAAIGIVFRFWCDVRSATVSHWCVAGPQPVMALCVRLCTPFRIHYLNFN